ARRTAIAAPTAGGDACTSILPELEFPATFPVLGLRLPPIGIGVEKCWLCGLQQTAQQTASFGKGGSGLSAKKRPWYRGGPGSFAGWARGLAGLGARHPACPVNPACGARFLPDSELLFHPYLRCWA